MTSYAHIAEGLAPQAKLVFDVLMSGRHITPLIAMTNLGVTSLTTRISELRGRGLPIKDRWANDYHGRRFKEYWLKQEGEADEPDSSDE